jgi:cysteine desulfurase
MERPIYLDYNATTPVDPRVLEAMLPHLTESFGNPSSSHVYGQEARTAIERARGQVAELIKARPGEIVFTGGGSETDNQAIKGVAFATLDRQPHIVTTTVEHPAVLNTLAYLRRRFAVEHTLVPVDEFGVVDPEAVHLAIRPNTVLVTIMQANNEVGTIQPIAEIGRIAHQAGALFHVDAAQSAGKLPLEVDALGADLLTIAGHKLYAPKGVGALFIRRGTRIDSLIHGSSQEGSRRAGTENVAGIVALGAAAEVAKAELKEETSTLLRLREELHGRLSELVPGLRLNGHPTLRLPNTLNVGFPGASGGAVLDCTPEVAASTGSACHSGQTDPSPVLLAMGFAYERALGAVRLSLGRMTKDADIQLAAEALARGCRVASGTRMTEAAR